MTQNTGWSQGGNDGASDATRPLQSVNGQPNYQGYQQAGYQASQNGYSQAYPQNGYGYRATATVASPAPEKSKRYGRFLLFELLSRVGELQYQQLVDCHRRRRDREEGSSLDR